MGDLAPKQDKAASFFRRIIGEILQSFNLAAILVHRTPEPTNTDLARINRYQEQYLAFGSSSLNAIEKAGKSVGSTWLGL